MFRASDCRLFSDVDVAVQRQAAFIDLSQSQLTQFYYSVSTADSCCFYSTTAAEYAAVSAAIVCNTQSEIEERLRELNTNKELKMLEIVFKTI